MTLGAKSNLSYKIQPIVLASNAMLTEIPVNVKLFRMHGAGPEACTPRKMAATYMYVTVAQGAAVYRDLSDVTG